MARLSTWFSNHGAKCATIALLAVPTVLPPFLATGHIDENRRMAPPPAVPTTWAEFLTLPAQTDAWVKDHFGFRTELVEANNTLRYALFKAFPSVQTSAGENGRMYVTAHAKTAPPYSAVVEVCDVNQKSLKEFGNYLNIMFDSFNAMGYSPKLMIVPSAPTVQSADLPAWLRKRCSSDNTPMSFLLKSQFINSNVKSSIYYPLAPMRARNQGTELFPRTWFHWNGPGIEYIVQDSMNSLFPSVKAVAPRLATHVTEQISDVSQMFPGIELKNTITEPDYSASHISACHGTTCFPEFKEFAEPLYDASRYHNPAAPDRRLLILSDSFGRFAAGWYARFYRSVEHMAVNNVRDLTREQVKLLGDVLLRDPATTDILFIFHDGALTGTLRLGLQRLHRNGEGGLDEIHNPADYTTLAQQIYVAYLGRPADVDGLRSLQRQLAEAGAPLDLQKLNLAYSENAGVRELIDSFGKSAESKALYPGDSKAFISAIYQQLFNRQPDTSGLQYWAEQITQGKLTGGRAVLAIAAAALVDDTRQGLLDGGLLRQKIAYSALFTNALMNAKRQCYAGATAARNARLQVYSVRIDTDVHQSKIAAAKMSDASCE